MLFSVNTKNISDKITCCLKKKKKKEEKEGGFRNKDRTNFQNLSNAIHYNLPQTASLRGDSGNSLAFKSGTRYEGPVVPTTLHLCLSFCEPWSVLWEKEIREYRIKKEKAQLSSFLGTVIKQKTQVIQWMDY